MGTGASVEMHGDGEPLTGGTATDSAADTNDAVIDKPSDAKEGEKIMAEDRKSLVEPTIDDENDKFEDAVDEDHAASSTGAREGRKNTNAAEHPVQPEKPEKGNALEEAKPASEDDDKSIGPQSHGNSSAASTESESIDDVGILRKKEMPLTEGAHDVPDQLELSILAETSKVRPENTVDDRTDGQPAVSDVPEPGAEIQATETPGEQGSDLEPAEKSVNVPEDLKRINSKLSDLQIQNADNESNLCPPDPATSAVRAEGIDAAPADDPEDSTKQIPAAVGEEICNPTSPKLPGSSTMADEKIDGAETPKQTREEKFLTAPTSECARDDGDESQTRAAITVEDGASHAAETLATKPEGASHAMVARDVPSQTAGKFDGATTEENNTAPTGPSTLEHEMGNTAESLKAPDNVDDSVPSVAGDGVPLTSAELNDPTAATHVISEAAGASTTEEGTANIEDELKTPAKIDENEPTAMATAGDTPGPSMAGYGPTTGRKTDESTGRPTVDGMANAAEELKIPTKVDERAPSEMVERDETLQQSENKGPTKEQTKSAELIPTANVDDVAPSAMTPGGGAHRISENDDKQTTEQFKTESAGSSPVEGGMTGTSEETKAPPKTDDGASSRMAIGEGTPSASGKDNAEVAKNNKTESAGSSTVEGAIEKTPAESKETTNTDERTVSPVGLRDETARSSQSDDDQTSENRKAGSAGSSTAEAGMTRNREKSRAAANGDSVATSAMAAEDAAPRPSENDDETEKTETESAGSSTVEDGISLSIAESKEAAKVDGSNLTNLVAVDGTRMPSENIGDQTTRKESTQSASLSIVEDTMADATEEVEASADAENTAPSPQVAADETPSPSENIDKTTGSNRATSAGASGSKDGQEAQTATSNTEQEVVAEKVKPLLAIARQTKQEKRDLHKLMLMRLFTGSGPQILKSVQAAADDETPIQKNGQFKKFPSLPPAYLSGLVPAALVEFCGQKQPDADAKSNAYVAMPLSGLHTWAKSEFSSTKMGKRKRNNPEISVSVRQQTTKAFSLEYNECSIAAISGWATQPVTRDGQLDTNRSNDQTASPNCVARTSVFSNFRKCSMCGCFGHYEIECRTLGKKQKDAVTLANDTRVAAAVQDMILTSGNEDSVANPGEKKSTSRRLACEVCHSGLSDVHMLVCDGCERLYHPFCVNPRLNKIPNGEWLCDDCQKPSHGLDPTVEIESCEGYVIEQRKSPRFSTQDGNPRLFPFVDWQLSVSAVSNKHSDSKTFFRGKRGDRKGLRNEEVDGFSIVAAPLSKSGETSSRKRHRVENNNAAAPKGCKMDKAPLGGLVPGAVVAWFSKEGTALQHTRPFLGVILASDAHSQRVLVRAMHRDFNDVLADDGPDGSIRGAEYHCIKNSPAGATLWHDAYAMHVVAPPASHGSTEQFREEVLPSRLAGQRRRAGKHSRSMKKIKHR